MEENVVIEEKAAVKEKVIVQEKVVVPKPRKSPALAGFLSAVFPFGVGAFYNGETLKGLIYLVVLGGLISLQHHGGSQPFAGILLAGFYFFQIIDSVGAANRINRRALTGGEVAEEEPMPEEVIKSGSIFWGALLILIGAVLVLGNFGVISYRAIFDFRPVVVIIIGVKLIFDYFSRNRS
jgi:TM2 domain-containing membrane protein YozV